MGYDTYLFESGQAQETSSAKPGKVPAKQAELVTLGQDLPQRHLSCLFPPQRHVGIAVRLTFETLEGEKASSELTVVNNGTVAVWYDWRRRSQLDSFQDLKRNRMQRFYFNNREGTQSGKAAPLTPPAAKV